MHVFLRCSCGAPIGWVHIRVQRLIERSLIAQPMQGYPLGVVPPLADPPAKKPAAEVDVPGASQTGSLARV